jgi:hypothetical protein
MFQRMIVLWVPLPHVSLGIDSIAWNQLFRVFIDLQAQFMFILPNVDITIPTHQHDWIHIDHDGLRVVVRLLLPCKSIYICNFLPPITYRYLPRGVEFGSEPTRSPLQCAPTFVSCQSVLRHYTLKVSQVVGLQTYSGGISAVTLACRHLVFIKCVQWTIFSLLLVHCSLYSL